MLERLAQSPSKSLVVLLAAFIGGVVIHAFDERAWLPAGQSAVYIAAVTFIALALTRRRTRLSAAVLALCLLGLWRYDAALSGLIRPEPLPEGDLRLAGTVAAEPRQDIRGTILTMDRVFFSGGERPLSARMKLVVLYPDAGARYGDRLAWSCRPMNIGVAEAGPAADLLLRRLAWQCYSREPPEVLSRGRPGIIRTALLDLKDKIRRTAGALLPEPEASFLLGLLIGERQGLPPDLTGYFRQTGTSHILAVSGYNVTRLIDIAFILCAGVALRRRRAAAAVSLGIVIFAAIVGGEASVVRAALMGGTSLLAVLWGRRYNGTTALLAAAAVMLAANPFVLRHDAGFQLSFAAVWGLHAFGRPLAARLTVLPDLLGLRQTAGETLAATIATLPIILHVFGRLPLIGPAVNLLILPIVPWAMAVGAAALVLGAVTPAAGLLPALVCSVLLRSIEAVVRTAAALPLTLSLQAGPVATAISAGWILLLWYALNRAEPVRIGRGPAPPDIDIEIIDYAHK